MAQKFVKLDDAATQLGISSERLNDLRDAGKVRAYRDGASWKFRTDDIDKLEADGIPTLDAGSSILAIEPELEAAEPEAAAPETSEAEPAATSDISLDLGDDINLAEGDLEGLGPASDLSLDDLDEPTVPADAAGDDEAAVLGDDDEEDPLDLSDSILLSETELGASTDRPPSTIIGKAEMAAELDLELASADDDKAGSSDVRLAPADSNVFSSSTSDRVLDTDPPSMSDSFGGVEELDIDLEAESSRILSPEEVAQAKQEAKSESTGPSSLDLAPSDSNAPPAVSGFGLDSGLGSPSDSLAGISSIELDEGDEDVLGDGSDITLSGESSGINIISPSDSGLALDDVSLDLGGSSPLASSIDLGSITGGEADLEPLEISPDAVEEDKAEEPFTLTPFGEEAVEPDEDSSQIIPLDEVANTEEDRGDMLDVGESAAQFTDQFGLPGAGVAVAAQPVEETQFPTWVMVLLSTSLVGLMLCGMMAFDLVRNIWSWDQPYSINSTLLEVVNVFLS